MACVSVDRNTRFSVPTFETNVNSSQLNYIEVMLQCDINREYMSMMQMRTYHEQTFMEGQQSSGHVETRKGARSLLIDSGEENRSNASSQRS
jgi:hypothetical protein